MKDFVEGFKRGYIQALSDFELTIQTIKQKRLAFNLLNKQMIKITEKINRKRSV